jgi:hypothetical protein
MPLRNRFPRTTQEPPHWHSQIPGRLAINPLVGKSDDVKPYLSKLKEEMAMAGIAQAIAATVRSLTGRVVPKTLKGDRAHWQG